MKNPKDLTPLHRRIDFILSIAIPTVISLIIGLTIISTDTLGQFCLRAECYENLLTTLKIPIAILAIAFPLAGMVAAYHRSIETNEQIRIAQTNNTFSNFIKHRDDFTEYFEEYLKHEDCHGEIVDLRRLYRLVFPDNDYTNFQIRISDADAIRILVEIEKVHNICEAISSAKYYWDDEFINLFLEIDKLNKKISLIPKKGKDISIEYNSHVITDVIFDTKEPLENIAELSAIANRIRSFNRLPLPYRPEWISDKKLATSISKFLQSHSLTNTKPKNNENEIF